jgi:hypothetical protein
LWASSTDGCLNPRKIEARKPIHPNEEIPVLQIPFRHVPTTVFSVCVKLSADDLAVREVHANIEPGHWQTQVLIEFPPAVTNGQAFESAKR